MPTTTINNYTLDGVHDFARFSGTSASTLSWNSG